MSDSMPQIEYDHRFAECADCGHVRGVHKSPEPFVELGCFEVLGIDGYGDRIICKCERFKEPS